jgi:hypothetical protein
MTISVMPFSCMTVRIISVMPFYKMTVLIVTFFVCLTLSFEEMM